MPGLLRSTGEPWDLPQRPRRQKVRVGVQADRRGRLRSIWKAELVPDFQRPTHQLSLRSPRGLNQRRRKCVEGEARTRTSMGTGKATWCFDDGFAPSKWAAWSSDELPALQPAVPHQRHLPAQPRERGTGLGLFSLLYIFLNKCCIYFRCTHDGLTCTATVPPRSG